jgi:hypothetical protein
MHSLFPKGDRFSSYYNRQFSRTTSGIIEEKMRIDYEKYQAVPKKYSGAA